MNATGATGDDGFDLGPSWIWPRMQPVLAALAHELGLATFGLTSAGDVVFERMSREPPQRYAGPAQEPQSMRLAGRTAVLVSAMTPTIYAACSARRGECLSRSDAAYTERDNLRAPRGALLYSPHSGHGLEEVSLDLMADP